jgi:protein-tyrosine-phosphatase
MYTRRVGTVGLSAPPPVFGLVGHPLRWRLLQELAASDRRVRELTQRIGVPQSLASYHLGRLRRAGVVFVRRSAADRRDVYYAFDLPSCLALLSSGGSALHPALAAGGAGAVAVRPARVLFLCTGNSARSQMAEALVRKLSDGIVRASSAGSRPKALHPFASRVLRSRGIELASARPKHWTVFDGERFDYVITLCDRVREVCPEFPGGPAAIHWSIPEPAGEGSSDQEILAAFERTAGELETRIACFLHQLGADVPERE